MDWSLVHSPLTTVPVFPSQRSLGKASWPSFQNESCNIPRVTCSPKGIVLITHNCSKWESELNSCVKGLWFKIFLSRFIITVSSSARRAQYPWLVSRKKQKRVAWWYYIVNTVLIQFKDKNDLLKAKFSDKSLKKKTCVIYSTVWFWKKVGIVYILLPESFNLLTVFGSWSLYNSVLKAKKTISGNLFAVTCAFGEYAFSLICSWNEYDNEFCKPKALYQFTFEANHSLFFIVNIFYSYILLLCIINLIFACGV